MCLQDSLHRDLYSFFALRFSFFLFRFSFLFFLLVAAVLSAPITAAAQNEYDLLLQGGHVIDPRNNVDAIRDVAISAGKITAIAPKIDAADAAKTIDARGLFVTPGIVDIHTHVYAGRVRRARMPATTACTRRRRAALRRDDRCRRREFRLAQLRGFQAAHHRSLDHPRPCLSEHRRPRHARWKVRTGSVGHGCQPTADVARRYPGLIVGIKTAHYSGPEWLPVERAVEAGTLASLPVMVDFGANKPERPLSELVTSKLRPGDIYTHMYSGLRGEQDASGKVNPALWQARKRGVLFDVGHGQTSFAWRIALPAIKEGWLPDVISTDLHVASMSGGMKDMPNVMSKFLALGLPFDEIIRRTTWNAASAVRQDALGHLSVGANADVAVWRIEKGNVGLVDGPGTVLKGSQRVVPELTLRNGKVVYDLNGLSGTAWGQ
jgi:dihydroorotase